jgi:hypothetical protein
VGNAEPPAVVALLLFLGVLALVGAVAYLAVRAERRRAAALRRAAEEMGFEFRADPVDGALGPYAGFPLFSQGRRRTIRNLLRGRAGGLEVAVFDYLYVTGGGQSQHTWRQTVLTFEIEGETLPTFSLRPESVFDKIGHWLGFPDINFESHPRFSGSYLLRGDDEDAVRRLFGDRVLDYYEANTGVCTEGHGRRLVYYRPHKRIAPAEVRPFLEEGFRVLALFHAPKEG